jgi:hypothetical protein
VNLYAYVFNEPTGFRDPLGLAVDPISWAAAGIACGIGAGAGGVSTWMLGGRKPLQLLQGATAGCAVGLIALVSGVAAVGAGVGAIIISQETAGIVMTAAQLQSKFRHAADFGVTGNYSPTNRALYEAAIRGHVADASNRVIQGTYRGSPATFYTTQTAGLQ